MTQRIAVFARPPAPGRVKTRLAPGLTATLAAALYGACLEDALAAASGSGADERWIYWAEPSADPVSAPGFGARMQRGADLGARLATAFEELLAPPADRALILGADCPELDAARLKRAFEALAGADLVLGPTRDGGYYLIGLTHLEVRLFEDVAWSTARVLEQTRDRAASAGLRVSMLEPLEDLDTAADLVRFIERACGSMESAPHARRALEAMALLPPTSTAPAPAGGSAPPPRTL